MPVAPDCCLSLLLAAIVSIHGTQLMSAPVFTYREVMPYPFFDTLLPDPQLLGYLQVSFPAQLSCISSGEPFQTLSFRYLTVSFF